jgi:hypothetical protein
MVIIVSALHDRVRLAEDSTAIALLTGNRFELGSGRLSRISWKLRWRSPA